MRKDQRVNIQHENSALKLCECGCASGAAWISPLSLSCAAGCRETKETEVVGFDQVLIAARLLYGTTTDRSCSSRSRTK